MDRETTDITPAESQRVEGANSLPGWILSGLRRIRYSHALITTIVVLAFLVRFSSIEYGLPYAYHWDEPEIIHPALRLLRHGIYKPDRFAYGPANTYLHAAWGVLSFVKGLGAGEFPNSIWGMNTNHDTGFYWSVTSPFMYYRARLLSAILGCVAVIAIFRAGALLGGIAAGLWAAAIIAFSKNGWQQTTFITADATSMAAASLALWASAHLYLSRARWSYWWSAVFAGLAMSLKIVNFSILLVPLLAHALSPVGRAAVQLESRWSAFRLAAVMALAIALSSFPIFLDPPRFLASLASEVTHYGQGGADGTPFSTLVHRAAQQSAVGLEIADEKNDAKLATGLRLMIKPYGFAFALFAVVGVALIATPRYRVVLLLLIPTVIHVLFVASTGKTFFSRNMLLMTHLAALLSGLGFAWCFSWAQSRARLPITGFKRTAAVSALAILLLVPMFARLVKRAAEFSKFEDPRVTLSKEILKKLPFGTSIAVLDETRWFLTSEETKRFKIRRATIPQLMIKPLKTSEVSYIIAPSELAFRYPVSKLLQEQVAAGNAWLKKADETLTFGSTSPWTLDLYTQHPKVHLLVNGPALQGVKIPENAIWGPAFFPVGDPTTLVLTDIGAGVASAASVECPLRITRPVKKATLRARSISTMAVPSPPKVSLLAFGTTDTLRAAPLLQDEFVLHRSLSGMSDYSIGVKIAPGNYIVRLRPLDARNGRTAIESLTFE